MARVFDETKGEWEQFKQKKSYPYIAAVLRALYIFFLYWLFSVLIFGMISKTTNVIKQDLIKLENLLIQLPIALIGSALELHSILLNTSQFDYAARHEFMER